MKHKLLAAFLLFSISVYAGEVSDLIISSDNSLAQVKSMLENEEREIKKLKNEKSKAARELRKAEVELKYQKKLAGKLKQKHSGLEKEISLINFKIINLKARQQKLFSDIKAANIYLTGTGETELVEALVLGSELTELTAGMQIISRVNSRLYNMATELEKNKTQMDEAVLDIKNKQTELAKALKDKNEVISQYNSKKVLVKQLYKMAQEDERIKQEYISMLQEREQELQDKLNQLHKMKKNAELAVKFEGLNKNFLSMQHRLPWPLKGDVIETFGTKKIKGFKGVVNKSGIKIAPKERYVSSIYDGVVIHTDSAWGLGWFAVVEHAGGYYSIYANMDDLSIKLNQKVHKGEILGTIDIDRDENTPYLYFEIRIHDKAVDPLLWLSS